MAARATGFNGVCTMAVADDEHAIMYLEVMQCTSSAQDSRTIVFRCSLTLIICVIDSSFNNPSLFIAKDTASVEIVLASSHVIVKGKQEANHPPFAHKEIEASAISWLREPLASTGSAPWQWQMMSMQ